MKIDDIFVEVRGVEDRKWDTDNADRKGPYVTTDRGTRSCKMHTEYLHS